MKTAMPRKAKLYILTLAVLAILVFIYTASIINWDQVSWFPVLVFLVLIVISESFPVPLPRGGKITVSLATIAAAILIFQPLIVILISFSVELFFLINNQNRIRHLFNIFQITIFTGLASLAYNLFAPPRPDFTLNSIAAFIAAMIIIVILNHTFVTLILAFTQNEKPYTVWLVNIKWCSLSFISMGPLGALIAIIYINIGFWGLVLFLLPLIIARHSFQSYMDMRETFIDTIKSLSLAIDAKDPYTKGHSSRVADYAVLLAKELKWPEDRVEFLKYVALIHDVGKVTIPEEILRKDSILTKDEYDIMKKHSAAGAEVIRDVNYFAAGSDIIKHHHERWDGTGYPDQLKGEVIPVGARILAVADAYDAMTSTRPYREALEPLEAIREIKNCSGTQFDPEMVKAMTRIIPQLNLDIAKEDHLDSISGKTLPVIQ